MDLTFLACGDFSGDSNAEAKEDTLREAFRGSYGTHLGLAFLRRHGDKVHRAIFAGVEGPDDTLKLPKNIQDDLLHVSELARQDESVSRKIPDLRALIAIVLKRLDPETQQTRAVMIGKFALQQTTLARNARGENVNSRSLLQLFVSNFSPPAVQAMARDILEQRTGPIGTAMGFAMDCASGASSTRRQTIEQQTAQSMLGGDIDFPMPQYCFSRVFRAVH